MLNTEVHNIFVVTVSRENVQAGSIGSFTAVAESMNLNVNSIGANGLPVYLEF